MAIKYVGVSYATSLDPVGPNTTIALPTGYQENDVCLFIYVESSVDNTSAVTLSGWTEAAVSYTHTDNGAYTSKTSVLWRRLTSSETDPITTPAGEGSSQAAILCYRGVRTAGNPYEDTATAATTSGDGSVANTSTTITAPAVTTSGANRMVVNCIGYGRGMGGDISSESNSTLRNLTILLNSATWLTFDGGSDCSGVLLHGLQESSATTGSTTATVVNDDGYDSAVSLALVPETIIGDVPIQTISDTSARTGATTTVTISSADGWATPTSGNYLVAMVSARNDSGGALTFTTPSGFTAGPTDTSGTTQAAVFYKTSDGTETSTDFAVGDGGGTLVNMNATLLEISSTGLSGGLQDTAEDTSDVSSADTATPSGTCTLTGSSSGLAVALIGTYEYQSRDGTPSWSNSYVQQAYTNSGNVSRAGVAIATKVLAATGNTDTIYTTTDSATAYGALLLFSGFDPSSVLYSRGRRANTLLRM